MAKSVYLWHILKTLLIIRPLIFISDPFSTYWWLAHIKNLKIDWQPRVWSPHHLVIDVTPFIRVMLLPVWVGRQHLINYIVIVIAINTLNWTIDGREIQLFCYITNLQIVENENASLTWSILGIYSYDAIFSSSLVLFACQLSFV